MIDNKEVMATNIKYFMELQKVNATEICNALGIKQNTFSDWVNAKTYPRIDKIEMMANYFGVSKADLVEERPKAFKTPEEFEAAWWELGGGKHPLKLTNTEYGIIVKYRIAEDIDKKIILRILGIKEGKDDG